MKDTTILVVDDEAEVRKLLARLLRYQGYCVRTTENAREALELLHGGLRLDLALVDLSIPEIGGVRLLRLMHSLDPELRFIAISGALPSFEEQAELNAMEAAFHAKPFRNGQVLQAIESKLRQGAATAASA